MSDINNNSSKDHIVILGAGPAGLATGHEVTTHDTKKVTVLERNNFVGGLCNTIEPVSYTHLTLPTILPV